MNRLSEFSLVLFCAAVGIHLGLSMQFVLLSVLGGLAPFACRYLPFRPIAPTLGLGFILLSVGGLGGYFVLSDVAAPGSWPTVFTVLAGICIAAFVLMIWMLAARQPDEATAPVGRFTQNILLTGLLLLFLTPYPSLEPVQFWVSERFAWLQLLALLAAVGALTLGRIGSGYLRRLALLLPLLLVGPAAYYGLQFLQRPLVMLLANLAPDFGSRSMGFSPLQFLDYKAFLTPSTRPVMRIEADQLPSRYLVGNRLVTMNGSSLSWVASKDDPLLGERQGEDEQRNWYRVPNHQPPVAPEQEQEQEGSWRIRINSLRWDSLVFLPPSASRVGVAANNFAENTHRVWEAKFESGARKEWLVSGGKAEPEPPNSAYLQLPTFWDSVLQHKAASLAGNGREETSRRVVAEYHQRGYTLEVQFDRRKPFHDFFLSNSPAYCFWYATGAALALRANGIPARLVSGYLINEQIGQRQWLVRERDAHSWVEWQDEAGFWHTLEPTPPAIGDFFSAMQGSEFSRYYHRFVLWWQNRMDSIEFSKKQENFLIIVGFLVLAFLFVREYLRIRAAESRAVDGYSKRWRKVWNRFLDLSRLAEKQSWSADRYAGHLPDAWSESRRALALEFLRLYERYRFSPQEPPFAELETILNHFRKAR